MPIFKLTKAKNTPVADDELIADLKRVAEITQTNKVTHKIYSQHGKYDVTNLGRRFGTWNMALEFAGLSISNQEHSDEKLFENILTLWQYNGRQPRRFELALPPSTVSQGPYNRRFSSWTQSLDSFVEYANASEFAAPTSIGTNKNSRKTSRDTSLRLRFKVLLRDNFTCQKCGSSPAKHLGVELHVDHVLP